MNDLKTLLEASIKIATLKREIGLLRLRCDMLSDENASLRRVLEGDSEFDLSADELPALLKRQI